jgi:hypothetical protein
MSFGEEGNLTSFILKFLVQNDLFLILKIIQINLIQNPMLEFFFDIPLLAKHIEFITIKHFVLRNPCMLPLKKLKIIKLLRF